ncbi:glycoside hydrolase family protein [Orbus mooreae]|uniref:glycoside hydrolase family protein n=1 Tax=Orbus mooreae TaxID=3074107 RepID=UPI00370DC64C
MLAEQCVNQYANSEKLSKSVFDAAVSITFNVGCSKMKTSTMYRYLNLGEYERACNELPRWNKSAGNVLNSLVIRRAKERELCLLDLNLS